MKRASLLLMAALLAVGLCAIAAYASEGAPSKAWVDPYAETLPSSADAGATALRAGAAGVDRSRGDRPLRRGGNGGAKLLTGFGEQRYLSPDVKERTDVFNETVKLNAGVARLSVDWRSTAPSSPSKSFDARDPGSPEYNWGALDAQIGEAESRGLRVLLLVQLAPKWAEGPKRPSLAKAAAGSWKPNPSALKDFAIALTTRYSGHFGSLPRVRDYQVWAEPNLPANLTPQFRGRKPFSPGHYRKMLNAFYDGAHGVSRKNNVVTGGTAPYGSPDDRTSIRPLAFWRNVMCIKGRGKGKLKATKCPNKAEFDTLAHHPIDTTGGPHTSAANPDDVSTPDLHNLVDVLRAAEKAGTIRPKGHRPVWATELWWETNPPDPATGNPSPAKQAEWYAESLYLLWRQGASMVLFLQVRDRPYDGTPGRSTGNYQTGVLKSNGHPKPSAKAVKFPFVAQRTSKRKVRLWGIAPKSGKLTVTQKGKGPKRVARIKVKRGKIFTKMVNLRGRHKLRATVGGESSLYWKLSGGK